MSAVLQDFLGEVERASKLLSSYEQQLESLKKDVDSLNRERLKLVDKNKQLDIELGVKKEDFEKSKKSFLKSAEDRNDLLNKKESGLKEKEAELVKLDSKLGEKELALKEKEEKFQKMLEIEKEKSAPASEKLKKSLDKLVK